MKTQNVKINLLVFGILILHSNYKPLCDDEDCTRENREAKFYYYADSAEISTIH